MTEPTQSLDRGVEVTDPEDHRHPPLTERVERGHSTVVGRRLERGDELDARVPGDGEAGPDVGLRERPVERGLQRERQRRGQRLEVLRPHHRRDVIDPVDVGRAVQTRSVTVLLHRAEHDRQTTEQLRVEAGLVDPREALAPGLASLHQRVPLDRLDTEPRQSRTGGVEVADTDLHRDPPLTEAVERLVLGAARDRGDELDARIPRHRDAISRPGLVRTPERGLQPEREGRRSWPPASPVARAP